MMVWWAMARSLLWVGRRLELVASIQLRLPGALQTGWQQQRCIVRRDSGELDLLVRRKYAAMALALFITPAAICTLSAGNARCSLAYLCAGFFQAG